MKLIICTEVSRLVVCENLKIVYTCANTFCVFLDTRVLSKTGELFRAFSTTPCNSRPRSLQLTQKKLPILCMCEQISSCHRQPAWNLGSCNPWNEAGNLDPGTSFGNETRFMCCHCMQNCLSSSMTACLRMSTGRETRAHTQELSATFSSCGQCRLSSEWTRVIKTGGRFDKIYLNICQAAYIWQFPSWYLLVNRTTMLRRMLDSLELSLLPSPLPHGPHHAEWPQTRQ